VQLLVQHQGSEQVSEAQTQIWLLVERMMLSIGRYDVARLFFDRLQAAEAAVQGNPLAMAWVFAGRVMWSTFADWNPQLRLDSVRGGVAHFEGAGDLVNHIMTAVHEGWACTAIGLHAEAALILRRCSRSRRRATWDSSSTSRGCTSRGRWRPRPRSTRRWPSPSRRATGCSPRETGWRAAPRTGSSPSSCSWPGCPGGRA
jgi:hypothetical protein